MPQTPTERFDTSRHLMESAARMSIKNEVLERLLCLFAGSYDSQRLHQDLLDIAMTAIPCEASSVFRVEATGGLTLVAARGRVAEKVVGLQLQRGQGIAGACADGARTIPVSDVASDPRHAGAVTKALGFETRSLLAVPIVHLDRVFGVIELVNKSGSNEFQRHEVELVERVGRSGGDLLAMHSGAETPAVKKGKKRK